MASETFIEIVPTQFRVVREHDVVVCFRDEHGGEYKIKLAEFDAIKLSAMINACILESSEFSH